MNAYISDRTIGMTRYNITHNFKQINIHMSDKVAFQHYFFYQIINLDPSFIHIFDNELIFNPMSDLTFIFAINKDVQSDINFDNDSRID